MTGLNCQWCAVASCEGSEPFSAWGLGTKYAFSSFWGTFLYHFLNNKILIFLDKLPGQTCLYTSIQIHDQIDMHLFPKNYFLLKYQSIMHKNHNAMFMINVHFIMYNLYEPMKIK